MLYQILTEDVNREGISAILDASFPAYTLIPSSGHWQGIAEPSLVAEIETDNATAVHAAAEAIRSANHQQAVLVEAIPSQAELVTA